MAGGFDRKPGGSTRAQEALNQPAAGIPGKQTLTSQLGAVQRKPAAPTGASAAAGGGASAGPGQPLDPGLRGDMERSFGSDFSSVQVHQGGAAEALGARAFAQGESIHVAKGEYDPSSQGSRKLIGHELAHVVQQRAGRVSTPQGFGGLGINDDPGLEAEADRAGERAARGEPAGISASGTAAGGRAPVQAKLRWDGKLTWLNAQTNPAIASRFATLQAMEAKADELTGGTDVDVVAEKPAVGAAAFSFKLMRVAVEPMPPGSEQAIESLSGGDVNDRAIALSHELQHVCDAFQSADKPLRGAIRKAAPWEDLIHAEWRAHATQVKAAIDVAHTQGDKAVPSRHKDLMDTWKTNTFDISQANKPQSMFSNTRTYIYQYSKQLPNDSQVQSFIAAHTDWVNEAFAMCPPLDRGSP